MKAAVFPRWISALVIAMIVFTSIGSQAQPVKAASPIYVTTWEDELNATSNGKCSLREAVISANEARAVGGCTSGTAGADEIILPANLKDKWGSTKDFDVSRAGANEDNSQTGDIDILAPLTISGAGSMLTVIASKGYDRVFDIIGLGTKQVVIEGVKISGGSNVNDGGGINNYASTLILRNVYITGNHANLWGGGVRNKVQPNPKMGSTLTIFNTIISTNTSNGDGGGIDNDGNLRISNSLISTNTAGVKGGGICNNSELADSVDIINTTITANIGVNGAGIYTAGEDLTLQNSTIYNNNGTNPSEAVVGLVVLEGNQVTLKNTIIAGHSSPRVNCQIQAGAVVISNGRNLEDANTCGLNPGGSPADLVNTPAGLDSFGAYGSGTQLYGLLPGSAAIDNGSNADCPSTDQRGLHFGRPADGNGDLVAVCDIGAFEADALPARYLYLPSLSR